jgi:hypothetical protein
MPTFESTAKAHESCPKDKLFHNDFRGWCALHDEWWELEPERGFDINTLKELTLNVKQAVWLLNRNFSNDDEWITPERGDTYQENVDLKIQVAVTNAGAVRISTWE